MQIYWCTAVNRLNTNVQTLQHIRDYFKCKVVNCKVEAHIYHINYVFGSELCVLLNIT